MSEEAYVSECGALVVDDQHFPVVIGTWFGDIEAGAVDAYFAWFDAMCERAAERGTKIVTVTDGMDVQRPSAAIRKRLAASNDARSDKIEAHIAGTVVAARGAIVLGAVASIVWLMRRGPRLTTASTMPGALERALTIIAAHGVATPIGLDPAKYVRPAEPAWGPPESWAGEAL